MDESQKDDNGVIELSDVLTHLRSELAEAKELAKDDSTGILFDLQDIEVELQTVVSTTRGADGKFSAKLYVLSLEAGANAQYEHAVTQTLKFKLKPVLKDTLTEKDQKGKTFLTE